MQIDESETNSLVRRILGVTQRELNSGWITRIEELAESAGAARFDLDWLPWTISPYLMATFVVEHFVAHSAINSLTAELDRREQAQ